MKISQEMRIALTDLTAFQSKCFSTFDTLALTHSSGYFVGAVGCFVYNVIAVIADATLYNTCVCAE